MALISPAFSMVCARVLASMRAIPSCRARSPIASGAAELTKIIRAQRRCADGGGPRRLGSLVDDQKWSPAIFHRPELLKIPRIVTQDIFATAHAVILLPATYTW